MKRIFFIIVATLPLLIACTKDKIVEDPEFEVSLPATTFKVGEPVTFSFKGAPEVITFYSGEKGADYEFKNAERIYDATTSLSFHSAKYAGNNDNLVALKYSTNFNGVYEPDAIRQATWVDITNRFHIPPINGTSAVMEFSNEKDISDIFPNAETPVYFGWFFTTAENSNRTRFQIINFEVKGVVSADTSLSGVKYNQASAGFQMVKGEGFQIQDHATTTPRVTSTAIIWDGVFANTSFKEGWAVSLPIYPASKINLGRDYGVGIKSVLDSPLKEYSTTYQSPGTYKAVFIASNVSIYGRKDIMKEVELTIVP
jgi:hypothetical protein